MGVSPQELPRWGYLGKSCGCGGIWVRVVDVGVSG